MADELKRYEAAMQMISDLCNGRRKWLMSIPAQPNSDPDLVIAASLADVPKLVAEIERLRAKLAGDALQIAVWYDDTVAPPVQAGTTASTMGTS